MSWSKVNIQIDGKEVLALKHASKTLLSIPYTEAKIDKFVMDGVEINVSGQENWLDRHEETLIKYTGETDVEPKKRRTRSKARGENLPSEDDA